MPQGAYRRDRDTLGELRGGPPSDRSVLLWLCEEFSTHEYGSAEIEPIFGWLRWQFERAWAGIHVIDFELLDHVDASFRPSLGLFLALTAPTHVDIALHPRENYELGANKIDVGSLIVDTIRDHVRETWASLGLLEHSPACLFKGTFADRFRSSCRDLGIDFVVDDVDMHAVRELAASLRRWPRELQILDYSLAFDNQSPDDIWINCVSGLRLPSKYGSSESVQRVLDLMRSGSLAHLRQLEIPSLLELTVDSDRPFEGLIAPSLSSLRVNGLGDSSTASLIASGLIPSLQSLEVDCRNVCSCNVVQLLGEVDGSSTREIRVQGTTPSPCEEIVLALRHARDLTQVESLTLDRVHVTRSGMDAVFANREFPNLRHLKLQWCSIEDGVLSGLIRTVSMPHLRSLEIRQVHSERLELEELLQSSVFEKLDAFALTGVFGQWPESLDQFVRESLVSAKTLANLKHLDLSSVSLRNGAFEMLCQNQHLNALETLILYHSGIDEEQLCALRGAEWVPQVRRLVLDRISMTASGLRALANAGSWERLLCLELSPFNLGREDEWSLWTSSDSFPALRALHLKTGIISTKQLRDLCDATFATQLTELRLEQVETACNVPRMFVQQQAFPNCTTLRIQSYYAERAHLDELEGAVFVPQLEELVVLCKAFSPEDIEGLVKLDLKNLRRLGLNGKNLTKTMMHKLMEAPWFENLTDIEVSADVESLALSALGPGAKSTSFASYDIP